MSTAENYREKARQQLIEFIKERQRRARESRRRRRRVVEEAVPPMPKPGYVTEYQKIKVIVREVHKVEIAGRVTYLAGVQIVDDGWVSPIFHIGFRNAKEFHAKLIEDISRYIMQKSSLGKEVVCKT
ncbi:MAG: hypothetical protein DRO23_08015 [Thermoprotei archaeon]|nr:MAG: hypothetical protein DRO23_08015 [Thermoprotei archaeon]